MTLKFVSNSKWADQFRDEILAHARKIALIHECAADVCRTNAERDIATARKDEMIAFAAFLAEIEFPRLLNDEE